MHKHKKGDKRGITVPWRPTSSLIVPEHGIFECPDPPLPFLGILSLEMKGLAVDGNDERRIILKQQL